MEEHIHPGQVGGHGERGQLDYLPVDFPLYDGNGEEHIHPGQVGGHGEGGQLDYLPVDTWLVVETNKNQPCCTSRCSKLRLASSSRGWSRGRPLGEGG
jgi:hypothetical protein